MQVASDESYRDPTNLKGKLQKHQAFEAEVKANRKRVDVVLAVSLHSQHCSVVVYSNIIVIIIIIIIIYLLRDDTVKQVRITVKRAGQQGVIIRTYKCPKLHKLVHFTK